MKQLLFYCFVLLALVSCNQRSGSGNIITENRQVGDFTGISVGGAFTVEVTIGSSTEVKVEADDNIMRYIETSVSGNKLHIRTKSGANFNNAHFKVYVTAPEINSINSSGASNVKVTGQLKSTEKISLEVSGAADIVASVDAPEISADINGAGTISLSGRTRDYKAEVSGGGDLKSADLKSENAKIEVSGAGKATVYASVRLKADASGAGSIHYKGGASVESKTSGAGSIKSEN